MSASATRPLLEVADIVRAHGTEYARRYGPGKQERKILRNIEQCRTAALGGHKDTCDNCGYEQISYNSCRDRHCPKCQSLKKAQWLEQRKRRLLPVGYFHVVFTLPQALHGLALANKALMYQLLFKAASKTLLTIARDQKHLGAQVGFTAILHTWGQQLGFHPHLHCVVTGGGLSLDGLRWVHGRDTFFLPVKVLGKLFRGKFLHELRMARATGKLRVNAVQGEIVRWKNLLDNLYRLQWVVYAKAPFAGPEHVYRYLGRYTHRVAISNHRLVSLTEGKVQFHWRDYADGQKKKTLTLDAVEFIRRFLLHALPPRFVRIRHYGLLAGKNVKTKLVLARELLGVHSEEEQVPESKSSPETDDTWAERFFALTGIDVFACPACKTGRLVRGPLDDRSPRHRSEQRACATQFDTS
jgi:hypothetical protein